MDKFTKGWRENVMSGVINFSPTYDTDARKCRKKAIAETFTPIDTYHTRYGHAFGEAMAKLYEVVQDNPDIDTDLACGYALLAGQHHIMTFYEKTDKGLATLAEVLPIVLMNVRSLLKVYDYVNSEHKRIIKVPFNYDGTRLNAIISGTYDVCLRHKRSGMDLIIDAKAIASQFPYSFHTEPQVLTYGILNEVFGGVTEPKGEYHVHIAKGNDVFKRISLSMSMYLRYPRVYIKHMIKEAKALAVLAYETEGITDSLEGMEFNPTQCKPNEYACNFYDSCHGTKKFNTVPYVDDRRPTAIEVKEVSEEELIAVGETIMRRAHSVREARKMEKKRYKKQPENAAASVTFTEVNNLFDI